VEHCDKTNENVICQIKQSLHDMVKNRKESFGKIHYCTSGVRCNNLPVCALTVAIYQEESWDK